jgi:peptidyl-prolyl cis-trans isomerase C
MAMSMTTNTKWMMGVVAAFALGVSTMALLSGHDKTAPATQDMAAIAEQMNDIQPVAGDAKPEAQSGVVVAKVNGQAITLDQVKAYAKTMPPQIAGAPLEQVFPMVQEQMVVGQIITTKADAENLASDPEVQQRIAMMRDNVIRATYIEREMAKRANDAAFKKAYDKFAKDFKPVDEVNAQHILVDDEAKAKEIIAKIKDGTKFEDMVKEFSKDKGANADGSLGYFKQSDMVPEFANAAFAMKKGELSKTPVKTQFGWHVIKVNDRRQSTAPSYEEMLPQIRDQVQRDTFEAMVAEWRQNANIEMFDMNGKSVAKAEPVAATSGGGEAEQKPATAQ